MKKDRSELKKEMLEMAEKRIEELLEWSETSERPTLSEIEGQMLRWRQKVSEEVTEQIIANQELVKPEGGQCCRECGGKMKYKATQEKIVSSWVGDLRIKRGYYYCSACKRGFFPPG